MTVASQGTLTVQSSGDDAPVVAAGPWVAYSSRQRWGLLAVLFLVSMSNYIDRNLMSVLLEPIKAEFKASDTEMGLLSGVAFGVLYATLGIPVARLADRGNRRRIVSLSLATWSVMTVLCGYARSFPLLFLARMGVGVGEAGAIPPAQSLIADYFPPEQRARALGLFMGSAMIGYLVAFTGGSMIAAEHGWRWAFIALGAPGLLLCVVTWFGLSEPRERAEHVTNRSDEAFPATLRALAAKRSFVLLTLSMIVYFIVAYGAVTWFPAYLVRVLQLPLASAGLTYGVVAAVAALIGSVGGGWVSDWLTRRDIHWMAWGPAVTLVICCPIYIAMVATDDFTWFLAAAFVGNIGLSAAVPAMFALLHRVCGSRRRAMAVAISFFFANLIGLGLGPVLTGVLSDWFTASIGPSGLRYALMISVALLLPSGLLLAATAPFLEHDSEA